MKIEEIPIRFVPRDSYTVDPDTLERAANECDAYMWMRAADNTFLCQHKDTVHVIQIDGDTVGCSCGAMVFHCVDNQACKHLATFLARDSLPSEPVPPALIPAMIKAGWHGTPGNMRPKTDADDEAPPLGAKTYDRECPYCRAVISKATHGEADAWLKEHMQSCDNNPANKDTTEENNNMKTKTKPTTVMETPGEPEPEAASEANAQAPAPEPEKIPTKTATPPDPVFDARVKAIIVEAEGFGAKDIDPAYVVENLDALTTYSIDKDEAHRAVVSGILRKQGLKRPKTYVAANQLMLVEAITKPDVWMNIRVKCARLWDSEHDAIRQSGIVGDETGTIRFVSWEKANRQLLEADKCYSIENVVSNEYEGMFSVAFTKNTTITEIDEEIEVGYTVVEFTGVLVQIQEGSGLIRRCPTCNSALQGIVCREHGDIKDGIPDLRLKLVLDSGTKVQNVLLNRERTEGLTGMTMEEAKAIAIEALDAHAVVEKLADELTGREFVVSGGSMGDTILVEQITKIDTAPTPADVNAIMEAI